jgi:hypothetical protein
MAEVADIPVFSKPQLSRSVSCTVTLQIQRPIDRLRKTATGIALGLAIVHLGMFVLMYSLLNQQTALVGCSTVLPPQHLLRYISQHNDRFIC